jgi:hypothetical protein
MAYQGWKNWETWNVALWFGNDQGLYNAVREHPKRFTASSAEEFVWELLPEGTPDFKKGQRAVAKQYAEVDWRAIADDFNEMRGESKGAHARESIRERVRENGRKPRKPIADMIEELRSWLPNYDHGPKDYPTLLFRILASLPGGEELEDVGYETFNIGWGESEQLEHVLAAIQDKQDVEDLVAGLLRDDEEEEVEEPIRRAVRRR